MAETGGACRSVVASQVQNLRSSTTRQPSQPQTPSAPTSFNEFSFPTFPAPPSSMNSKSSSFSRLTSSKKESSMDPRVREGGPQGSMCNFCLCV